MQNKQVNVRMTERLINRVEEVSEIKGVSFSEIVRSALDRYLEKQEESLYEECAYCGKEIPAHKLEVPAEDDEEAWEALAKYHRDWCEWITTRAHRRDG